MHRRCAGDEALYDSGFKNIIRTEVPALLLKRGRKKNKKSNDRLHNGLQSSKIPKGRQLGGSDECFILFFKVKHNRLVLSPRVLSHVITQPQICLQSSSEPGQLSRGKARMQMFEPQWGQKPPHCVNIVLFRILLKTGIPKMVRGKNVLF